LLVRDDVPLGGGEMVSGGMCLDQPQKMQVGVFVDLVEERVGGAGVEVVVANARCVAGSSPPHQRSAPARAFGAGCRSRTPAIGRAGLPMAEITRIGKSAQLVLGA
jgi:hypothetical protein